jgi:hypothetical protein
VVGAPADPSVRPPSLRSRLSPTPPTCRSRGGTPLEPPAGTAVAIGKYVLNYVDGKTAELPIVPGRHVRDWQVAREQERQPMAQAVVAWSGTNHLDGRGWLQLYKADYENPRPEVEVKTLDFVSAMSDATPFVVAITVKP